MSGTEENLVGYLLDALDSEERERVEAQMREDPETARRIEILRRALAPLAQDRDEEVVPPSDLFLRTIGHVAHYRATHERDIDSFPDILTLKRTPPRPQPIVLTGWWRRADALVAACLMVTVVTLIPTAISHARYRHDIVCCKNNLRGIYDGAASYANMHDGRLPDLCSYEPPYDMAGMFVPALSDAGFLKDTPIGCSATKPRLIPSVDKLRSMSEQDAATQIRDIGGSYGYPLGYHEKGVCQGLKIDDDPKAMHTVLLADQPPTNALMGNSSNHRGRGQNVLYLNGNCVYTPNRKVGVDCDDIYLNDDHVVAAGKHRLDSVVGASTSRP